MEQIKRYRFPALFCAALVVLALAAGIAINLLGANGSAAGHISMGQRYLNDLNYSEAILEFTNAIEMDPGNREARQGLATAYMATDNYTFAADVLEDVQDEYNPDEQITNSLVQIYLESENYGKAITLVEQLVSLTDEDQYYDQKQQLMQTWYAGSRNRAVGTDQELMIQNGTVVSRGHNTLGQLGTANGLGQPEYNQTDFASAEFPGTPKSVYCAGRTSYVLDTSGNLWACGENRWGQMGASYATTLPAAGWTQITNTGDVVAAAGTTGQMLVLKSDGSLWEAGAGTGQTLTRVGRIPSAMKVCANTNCQYILTTDGTLYSSQSSYYFGSGISDGWSTVARDVVNMQVCDSGAVWLDQDGNIGSQYGFSVPQNWTTTADGMIQPPMDLVAIAGDGNCLVMLGTDNTLYMLKDGTVTASGDLGHIIDLYYSDGSIMIELEDGSRLSVQDGQLQAAA